MSIIDNICLSTSVYDYASPVCPPVGYQVKISGQVWYGSKGVFLDINTRFSFIYFRDLDLPKVNKSGTDLDFLTDFPTIKPIRRKKVKKRIIS